MDARLAQHPGQKSTKGRGGEGSEGEAEEKNKNGCESLRLQRTKMSDWTVDLPENHYFNLTESSRGDFESKFRTENDGDAKMCKIQLILDRQRHFKYRNMQMRWFFKIEIF